MSDERLVAMLVERGRSEGLPLAGRAVAVADQAGTDYLSYEKHDAAEPDPDELAACRQEVTDVG